MWLWYNTQLINSNELLLPASNRAFQYGDGIFETIIVRDGKIGHEKYHGERLAHTLKVFKLNFSLSFEEVVKRINFLLNKNKQYDARVKIIVWREQGGLYVPQNNDAEYLITSAPLNEVNRKPQHLEISQKVKLSQSFTQNCKTLNALPYIFAGLELKEKDAGVDDLILLDGHDNVSECISSNIFWSKGNDFFTPSLKTNCVAGVKRAFVIDQLRKKNIPVHEVEATVEDLKDAEIAFKTNVNGIVMIQSIKEKHFDITQPVQF